jgi:hypothetical protein
MVKPVKYKILIAEPEAVRKEEEEEEEEDSDDDE